MSDILQQIRGKLNQALNTINTPPIAPVGGLAPTLGLGHDGGPDPCYNRGGVIRTTTAAAAAGAIIATTPELIAGCYDFRIQASMDAQAATRQFLIQVSNGGVGTVFLDGYRFDAGNAINIDVKFAFIMLDNDRMELLNTVLATNTVITAIYWKRRLIDL